ncbi:hypothetical protein C8R45DRAFT_1175528 [Mycena sanguinolenta]|nr:hypothetical protein C8R45DRAFT_1175528 [Mycena sanguinolenta]
MSYASRHNTSEQLGTRSVAIGHHAQDVVILNLIQVHAGGSTPRDTSLAHDNLFLLTSELNRFNSKITIEQTEENTHFVIHDLPNVIGNTWFWMDILCVDQRDGDTRVVVMQHIPPIFRAAIKTVVIRESTGFRDCCVEAAGLSHDFMGKTCSGRPRNDHNKDIDFTEGMDGWQKLRLHLEQEHAEDNIKDGGLDVELRVLRQVQACPVHQSSNNCKVTGSGIRLGQQSLDACASMGHLWFSKAETSLWHRMRTGKWEFLDAFFHCRETRRGSDIAEIPKLPLAREFCIPLSSMRCTSKLRDFILLYLCRELEGQTAGRTEGWKVGKTEGRKDGRLETGKVGRSAEGQRQHHAKTAGVQTNLVASQTKEIGQQSYAEAKHININ